MRFRFDLRFYDLDDNLCRCLDLYCTLFQAKKSFFELSFAFVGSRYRMLELVKVGEGVCDTLICNAFNDILYIYLF